MFEIAQATPADRDHVVVTVVAPFVANPAYRFFFPDDDTYNEFATTFTQYLFDQRVDRGTVWLGAGGASVALWDPPAPVSQAVPPPQLPAEVQQRIELYDQVVQPLVPAEPHWYLQVLATHPDHAGHGWGRILLAAGVKTAHAEGLPAYLGTTNPSNVDIYQRAGFAVIGQADDDVPATWVLANRPQKTN